VQITKQDESRTLVKRGNHKSAKDEACKVAVLLTEDVLHSFSVVLPVNCKVPTTEPTRGSKNTALRYREAVHCALRAKYLVVL
jgi:hypothetical protein